MPQSLMSLSKKYGIPYTTLLARLNRGWSIQYALTTPVQPQRAPCHERGTKQCTRCGEEKDTKEFIRLKRRNGNEFSPACRECDRRRTREARRSERLILLSHYSNGLLKCATCPENRVDVLDLDHINGGGVKERSGFKTTHSYYKYLRNSGFPSGIRVLCRNCNWIAWIERKNRELR